ncbi:MAG: HAMP domain-containing protein [Fimbriimonadaceae bacterium]|nr:HAMP domain-containing protein [Fimbriimonadaceae bacterium]
MKSIRANFGARLILLFLLFGLLPAIALTILALRITTGIAQNDKDRLESAAVTVNSRIERNLYERYGDVQAFGLNTELYNQEYWYKTQPDAPLRALMNRNLATYTPIYLMSMMVDLNGRVIAISSKSDTGEPVNTDRYFSKNFKDQEWFKNCVSGKFLETDQLSGTWVDDVQVDEDIKEIFKTDGMYIGYASPVHDRSGKIIGVWRNYAKMKVVQEIFEEAYQELKQSGYKSAHLTLINDQGVVLTDYNPMATGKTEYVNDMNVLLKRNLKEEGYAPAVLATSDKSGAVDATDKKSSKALAVGYHRSHGALGYAGLGWSVLVQIDGSEIYATAASTRKIAIAIVLIATVLIAVFAYLLSKAIVRPLNEMSSTLKEVYVGNTDVTIKHQGEDEIGLLANGFRTLIGKLHEQIGWAKNIANGDLRVRKGESDENDALGQAFRGMASTLSTVIGSVKSFSRRVSGASDDLKDTANSFTESSKTITERSQTVASSVSDTARAAHEVAQACQEQANHINNVVAQVQTMHEAMEKVEEMAVKTAESTVEATEIATSGGQAVMQTLDGMSVIRKTTGEASSKLTDLEQKSSQIDEIVRMIDDIAEQTNLLALNAAIEAARAGEQGRGFAVVAEEVRKLAERSQTSTKEITALIQEVRTLVSDSTSAMGQATEAVEDGTRLSELAREALENILEKVEELRKPVESVTTHAREVKSMAEDVHSSMNKAAHVTEQNAAAAEEMAASASEIQGAMGQILQATDQQENAVRGLADQTEQLGQMASQLMHQVEEFIVDSDAEKAQASPRIAA